MTHSLYVRAYDTHGATTYFKVSGLPKNIPVMELVGRLRKIAAKKLGVPVSKVSVADWSPYPLQQTRYGRKVTGGWRSFTTS